jgi:hypothetical protein
MLRGKIAAGGCPSSNSHEEFAKNYADLCVASKRWEEWPAPFFGSSSRHFTHHSQTEIQSSLSYKYLPLHPIQIDTLKSGL